MEQLGSEFEFRRARPDDLAAEYQVFSAAQGALWAGSGLTWNPPGKEQWLLIHQHLLAHDGGQSFVATDDGEIVGFAAAFVRDETWFLSALFVLPAYQARGLGKELFALAWGGDYRHRITITEAIQPASSGLYARHGLIPTTPILHLSGIPADIAPEQLTGAPADLDALSTLDQVAYDFDRAVDHRFWSKQAKATLWLAGDEPIAYSYVGPDGRIGPLAARDGECAARALRAELSALGGRETSLAIPGTARELVVAGLASGLRLRQPPGLLLLNRETSPPDALAIRDYWLY